MTVLEIQHLSFAYEKQIVLEDINLKIKQNDFLAIIGPNGGGKSTLLKLILNINPLTKGSIKIFNQSSPLNIHQIGYVPQNTNVNTNFPIKVIEVVMMGYKGKNSPIFGHSKEEMNFATTALKKVGMENFSQNKIGSLSGGQRQRVMIARALCASPKILLLDEPTSSIDITGQKEIYQLLKELNKNITIIVVSHDISVILEYASCVAHINKTLSYHDISNRKKTFHTHNQDEHFCEIELLQMLATDNCNRCESDEK